MNDGPFYLDDELMSLVGLLPTPAAHQDSAFATYQQRHISSTATSLGWSSSTQQYSSAGGGVNVHRSMHQYLTSIGASAASTGSTTPTMEAPPADELPAQSQVPRSSRLRHITRERLRRERLSQGYADLQALLPPGRASKGTKNSVLGAAAGYIRELEGRKSRLSARNEGLGQVASPAARSGGARGGQMVVIKVRAGSRCHRSTLDVFEVVLRRLTAMEELRVTAIHSRFCAGVMRMDVGVESKISLREADMAVTNALIELQEMKSLCLQDPTDQSRWSFSCQIASGVLMR